MDVIQHFIEIGDEIISFSSPPLGVKFLAREEDVPPSAGRPVKDLGEPTRPCIAWHLARHDGLPIAMLKEDFTSKCPLSLFVFGVIKPIQQYLEGGMAIEAYAPTKEVAAKREKQLFLLEAGKYKGVVFAPLQKADFVPDIIFIHCNTRQLLMLTAAAPYRDGEALKPSMSGRAICSEGLVQPFLTGKPVVALPCGGDREHGRCQDHEMVFATPLNRLEGIIEGLEAFNRWTKKDRLGVLHGLGHRQVEWSKMLDPLLGR